MPPISQITSDSDLESVLELAPVVKSRRSSAESKYFCPIEGCGQSFKRLDHLDRHEYHHTGIKKHICMYEDCDKSYKIVTHLKRHIRNCHERTGPAPKNVPCTVEGCKKMFPSITNMERHVREVHENPKVYRCSHCGEKFTQKLKMRRHEITKHTGIYPFNCEKCSRGFFHQWQYDRHLESCKIYPCPNCSMIFEKWTLYLSHCRETQHGRQYYKCEFCERVYAKPGELRKHVAVKHDGQEETIKCPIEGCDRSYTYERNLKQHMRTAHDGKRFPCSEQGCDRVFISGQNLAKHLEREHCKRKREEEEEDKVTTKTEEKPKVPRKKRKDAGKPAVSYLSKLSAVPVDREFDKFLRARNEQALEMISSTLEQEMLVTDESTHEETTIDCNEKQKHGTEGNDLESLMTAVLQDA